MRHRPFIPLFFAVLLLSSCATADRMANIQTGMSRQDVIDKLGSPKSSRLAGDKEYLTYYFFDSVSSSLNGAPRAYTVRLNKGIVETHGRLGDVD